MHVGTLRKLAAFAQFLQRMQAFWANQNIL
jgi:hypothetical protein